MPVPIRQKTLDSRRGRPCPLGSGLEVSQMSSQAIQSHDGLLNPERVGIQNPDRAVTVDFRLVDFGLLAALIGTIIFFAVRLF